MRLDVFISSEVFTALMVIIVLYLVKKILSGSANLPPGPTGYPIIWSLYLAIKDPMYIACRKLRQQYGDIFSLRIGSKLIVVINGYETLREAFVKTGDLFSDRADTFGLQRVFKGKGLTASSGQYWKDTRTLAINILRGFGFGKRSLESQIVEEVEAFHRFIDDQQGEPCDIKQTLQNCASNVICNLVFGRRFEHGDKEFVTLLQQFDELLRLNILGGPLNFFPFLQYIPGDIFGKQSANKVCVKIFGFLDESIAYHRKTLDENNPRDFIDAFLIEQKKNGHKEFMQDENLQMSLFNILIAGTQTTANTAYWAILFLLYNKDVQERLRQEIETVVGSYRLPSLEDKNNMPYFEAFFTEAQRIGNIDPLSVPYGLKQDVQFRGYTLPKGAVVFLSLDSAMSDPEFFKNPNVFDPTRFLDTDGRRVCMGESLARMELFLLLTALVQRYQILPEDENNLPTQETLLPFAREVQKYQCKFVKIE